MVYSIVIEVIFSCPADAEPTCTPITSVPVPVPGTMQLNAFLKSTFGAASLAVVVPTKTPSYSHSYPLTPHEVGVPGSASKISILTSLGAFV